MTDCFCMSCVSRPAYASLTCVVLSPCLSGRYWLEYDLVCKVYLFFLTFNIPLSAFIMVAVGFDRYFCICHPFLHAMTVKRAKICLVCLTLLASALGVITALSYGVYYTDTVEVTVNSSASSTAAFSAVAAGATTVTTVLETRGENESLLGSAYAVVNGTSNSLPVSAGVGFESSTRSVSRLTANGSEPLTKTINQTVIMYYGYCVPNQLILSVHFTDVYQKVYAGTFLLSFLIIALLYALIYRSILIRRAWKAKRKRMSCYASTVNGQETAAEETQLTNVNNGNTNVEVPSCRVSSRTSVALRDRMLYANIKTAAMLFVVTVVFIISFLPSWLIGLGVVPMYYILFYMFFLNNVANPFIYAFMNRTFRDDLRQLLRRIKNRLSGW